MAAYGKKSRKKVKKAVHEYKHGKLKSGKSGRKVKSRKQAIAIGLSEARKAGGKVPKRKSSRKKSASRKKSSSKSHRKSSSRKKSSRKRKSRKQDPQDARRRRGDSSTAGFTTLIGVPAIHRRIWSKISSNCSSYSSRVE